MIRILVLEDDAKLNQMVCTYLNDSGFQAKGCLHANDAYDEMYNSLYDLIISDITASGTPRSGTHLAAQRSIAAWSRCSALSSPCRPAIHRQGSAGPDSFADDPV